MVPCNPTIKAAVLKAGLAFTDLELELTEAQMIENLPLVNNVLDEIAECCQHVIGFDHLQRNRVARQQMPGGWRVSLRRCLRRTERWRQPKPHQHDTAPDA